MRITVGHTPDADDAFMFYGMLTGKVSSPGFEIEHQVEDIERLNRRAQTGDLDVTAVSVHACAYIPGYTILRSGGSFGLGYGPVVVARRDLDTAALSRCKIAVPGRLTSAFLLLQLMIGKFEYVEMDFDQIPEAVRKESVDAGLVIHEAQITYRQENLARILDVGEWWNSHTGGLPVPLGINVARTGLGMETICRFDRYLRDSIVYGMDHREDAIRYAIRYGRGNSTQLISRFVNMYVNSNTVDMGKAGEDSIRQIFAMANERGLVSDFDLQIADQTYV